MIRKAALVVVGAAAIGLAAFPTDHDVHIQSAWEHSLSSVFPSHDWTILKALLATESSLRCSVRSSKSSAFGMGQLVDGTFTEVSVTSGMIDRQSCLQQIHRAAEYLAKVSRVWTADRTERQHLELALQSYHSGPGTVLAAQLMCGGCVTLGEMRQYLPEDQQDYVVKIFNLLGE